MTNDWVSVKDRLPDNGGDVLVCDTNHQDAPVAVANYISDPDFEAWETDSDFWQGNDIGLEVTHWMPLPELPKQVQL